MSSIPPRRLVATDLDGTLLDASGKVTPRTAAAVVAARAAGIHVVPVTGRPPQAMWSAVDGAGLGPYAVCSNGAVTIDMEERTVVEELNLSAAIATRLVERVRAAIPGAVFATDNLDRFCHETSFFDRPVTWEEEIEEVPDIKAALEQPCIKLIVRLPGTGALELIAMLEGVVGEEGHTTTSGLDWVDIGAPGITKAYALERVCARLGVHVDDVVAVGDNHNDLSVLGWAGTAMAPSNAVAEVLALADRVLPHHDREGVAVLLEEMARG
ncbi:Cof-type HAD-IIB family hydrolase [Acidiferrimicrobium sp. IK]|uniref:HAD family hydrolase n=1 Tax=Acidiferrimicrobium sp. IK TaxID=2871700 RepID=UPI0021CB0847|nr:HAD family hydrolase [Acidiferrimicrobium sp. IK]MCU4184758.1 Cof-type HAD-IIB family hydrolase [Acidiferrimicrobium sp. IK]